jgi:hypothetical protein
MVNSDACCRCTAIRDDAASVWFSGRPAAGNNARDGAPGTGIAVPEYLQRFRARVAEAGGAAGPGTGMPPEISIPSASEVLNEYGRVLYEHGERAADAYLEELQRITSLQASVQQEAIIADASAVFQWIEQGNDIDQLDPAIRQRLGVDTMRELRSYQDQRAGMQPRPETSTNPTFVDLYTMSDEELAQTEIMTRAGRMSDDEWDLIYTRWLDVRRARNNDLAEAGGPEAVTRRPGSALMTVTAPFRLDQRGNEILRTPEEQRCPDADVRMAGAVHRGEPARAGRRRDIRAGPPYGWPSWSSRRRVVVCWAWAGAS